MEQGDLNIELRPECAPVARDNAALGGKWVQLWLIDPEEEVVKWTRAIGDRPDDPRGYVKRAEAHMNCAQMYAERGQNFAGSLRAARRDLLAPPVGWTGEEVRLAIARARRAARAIARGWA